MRHHPNFVAIACRGLHHRDAVVKECAATLIERMESFNSTRGAVNSLNYFVLSSFNRRERAEVEAAVVKEQTVEQQPRREVQEKDAAGTAAGAGI